MSRKIDLKGDGACIAHSQHTQSHLCEGEVALVSEGGVDKLGCVALVLKGVVEGCVTHAHGCLLVCGDVVAELLLPGPVLCAACALTNHVVNNLNPETHVRLQIDKTREI